jgi:hypothetical protein
MGGRQPTAGRAAAMVMTKKVVLVLRRVEVETFFLIITFQLSFKFEIAAGRSMALAVNGSPRTKRARAGDPMAMQYGNIPGLAKKVSRVVRDPTILRFQLSLVCVPCDLKIHLLSRTTRVSLRGAVDRVVPRGHHFGCRCVLIPWLTLAGLRHFVSAHGGRTVRTSRYCVGVGMQRL